LSEFEKVWRSIKKAFNSEEELRRFLNKILEKNIYFDFNKIAPPSIEDIYLYLIKGDLNAK